MEELGPLCPLCSCELIILCTTKLSRNTHQTPKKTRSSARSGVFRIRFQGQPQPFVAIFGDLIQLWMSFFEKKPVTMFRRCHLHLTNSFASQYVSTWSLEIIGTISFFESSARAKHARVERMSASIPQICTEHCFY